jgi:hypothetical protein
MRLREKIGWALVGAILMIVTITAWYIIGLALFSWFYYDGVRPHDHCTKVPAHGTDKRA